MSQGGTGRQRRVSRAKLQERRLQAAAAVDVAPSYDVVVVGGGASGLVAAICAGEKGAHVLLLESSPECGRPLLATGNGRCNFSNVGLAPKYYNDPAFVQAVFGDDPLADILSFFRHHRLRQKRHRRISHGRGLHGHVPRGVHRQCEAGGRVA